MMLLKDRLAQEEEKRKKDELYNMMTSFIAEDSKEYDKIVQERLEYGYDSICLRINELVTELAIEKSKDKKSFHYGDIDYWKQRYGMRAIRIFNILDDLLDGKGHSYKM